MNEFGNCTLIVKVSSGLAILYMFKVTSLKGRGAMRNFVPGPEANSGSQKWKKREKKSVSGPDCDLDFRSNGCLHVFKQLSTKRILRDR